MNWLSLSFCLLIAVPNVYAAPRSERQKQEILDTVSGYYQLLDKKVEKSSLKDKQPMRTLNFPDEKRGGIVILFGDNPKNNRKFAQTSGKVLVPRDANVLLEFDAQSGDPTKIMSKLGRTDITAIALSESAINDRTLQFIAKHLSIKYLDIRVGKLSIAGAQAISAMPSLENVTMRDMTIAPSALEQLASCRCGVLEVTANNISPAVLRTFSRMPNLKRLALDYCKIDWLGAADVKLSKLEFLGLSATQPDRKQLQMALKLADRLQELSLNRCPITDSDLELVSKALPRLKSISLHRTKVSDRSLPSFKKLAELTSLDLSNTTITDQTVLGLAGFQLSYLDLSGTAVTDRGARAFQGSKTLRFLDLDDTEVTDAIIDRLRHSMPACELI